MTVLVLGKSGQLASHLRIRLPEAVVWGRADQDVTDTARLERCIRELAPKTIINAAAYTAVDAAESHPDLAWRLNAEAPAAMARAASAIDATLIHVSTDYAFDGTAQDGYSADTAVRPINTYGRTKVAGEYAVASLCERHWILRTSWVFSEFGSNFARTMLRLADADKPLQIVSDQYGRPSYAGHLARLISGLVAASHPPPWGTYHAVGGPAVSWYEFAQQIFARAHALGRLQKLPDVSPVMTADYPTLARRPLRAVLAPSLNLLESGRCEMYWPDAIDQVVDRG